MSRTDAEPETERLAALRDFAILDTPPDGTFDRITALAARFFDVPISLVSLVDEDRIWMKSSHGVELEELERDPGLCDSVILSDAPYVVENAPRDPRTLANPLVAGEFGLRFYAAHPLVTSEGHRLGTINVIDFEPREVTAAERHVLADLAGLVVDQMQLRMSTREIVEQLSRRFAERRVGDVDTNPITLCAWTKQIRIDGRWYSLEEFLRDRLGASVTHGIHPEAVDELLDETAEKPER